MIKQPVPISAPVKLTTKNLPEEGFNEPVFGNHNFVVF